MNNLKHKIAFLCAVLLSFAGAGNGFAQAPCSAQFTQVQTAPNTISFTSTSTGTISSTSYQWIFGDGNSGVGSATSHVYNIPGSYTARLFIFDSIPGPGGCRDSISHSVTVTGTIICNLTSYISSTSSTCSTCADGSATVNNVSGGTAPYSYSWSSGALGASANSLLPGLYHVCVTDANACTRCDSIRVLVAAGSCHAQFTHTQTAPNVISFTNTSTGALANARFQWNMGDGNSLYTRNIAPYTYAAPGVYTVTLFVSDSIAGSCNSNYADTVSVTGSMLCLMTVSTMGRNASCSLCSDGAAYVNISHGTAPYRFSWSPNTDTTSYASNLAPGVYRVCVTDANACVACASYTVGISTSSGCHSNFTLVPNGSSPGDYIATTHCSGFGQLHYYWSWGDGTFDSTTNAHHYAAAGLYRICLTITDSIGCQSTFCDTMTATRLPSWLANHHTVINIIIGSASVTGIQELTTAPRLEVYPNPSTGTAVLSYSLDKNSDVLVTVYNLQGQICLAPEQMNNQAAGKHELKIDGSNLSPGTYLIRVTSKGWSETRRFVLIN